MRLPYVLCVLLFVSSSQLFGQLPKTEREWSDKSGKFKTTGVLKRIEKRHIILKTAKKDEVKVPIAMLTGSMSSVLRFTSASSSSINLSRPILSDTERARPPFWRSC